MKAQFILFIKVVPSAHDKADCDCGADRLWTITSDVFIDVPF